MKNWPTHLVFLPIWMSLACIFYWASGKFHLWNQTTLEELNSILILSGYMFIVMIPWVNGNKVVV